MPDSDAQWEGVEAHRPRNFLWQGVARLHTGETKCEVGGCSHFAIWAVRIGYPADQPLPDREVWESDGKDDDAPYDLLTENTALLCDCHMGQTFLTAEKIYEDSGTALDIHFTDERYGDDPEFTRSLHDITDRTPDCALRAQDIAQYLRPRVRRKGEEAAQGLIDAGVMTRETKEAIEAARDRGDKETLIRLLMEGVVKNIIERSLGEAVSIHPVVLGKEKEPRLPSITDDDALDAFDALKDAETLGDFGFGDIDISEFDN